MHRFANPTRFLRLTSAVLPYAAFVAIACLGTGLIWGLGFAPPDYQQGDTVRIMFIHVPSAMMSQGIYVGMAVSSAIALIWKHAVADMIAKASAPIGAMFCFLCLLTGSLWGKPMWGTWWVWDARLTSVLIQFFIYIGYMALWQAIEDEAKAAVAAAILAIVGVVMVPIIRFSVDWWNTLHQGATVITMDGPKVDNSMLWPLLLMIVGFLAYYLVVLIYRVRAEIHGRQSRMMRMAQASRHAAMQPAE
ncbi:heme ABC transporter permease [Minwuia sp.]|uniref:heme ABC transporter permease n=1 Tax=Minwuia sp. TaxID=2493630 RepID=UPI003A8F89E1